MAEDADRGYIKIEYDCQSLDECHIKGVYRAFENEITLEDTQEVTYGNECMVVMTGDSVVKEEEKNVLLESINNYLEQFKPQDM